MTLFSTKTSKGWPLRHCKRQGWYHYNILKMHRKLGEPLSHNLLNPSEKPWSEEELKVFEDIRQKLVSLYNNRYEEYYRMRTLEKGLEYYPRNKKNKFILQ